MNSSWYGGGAVRGSAVRAWVQYLVPGSPSAEKAAAARQSACAAQGPAGCRAWTWTQRLRSAWRPHQRPHQQRWARLRRSARSVCFRVSQAGATASTSKQCPRAPSPACIDECALHACMHACMRRRQRCARRELPPPACMHARRTRPSRSAASRPQPASLQAARLPPPPASAAAAAAASR